MISSDATETSRQIVIDSSFFPQPWQTILEITTWRKSIDQDTVSPESLKTKQAKHIPDQKMRNTVSGELQFNTDIVIQPTREYT